jgi:hypothetical protein
MEGVEPEPQTMLPRPARTGSGFVDVASDARKSPAFVALFTLFVSPSSVQ